MILDAEALFSDDQAITITAASTNLIDLGTPGTPIRAAQALTPDLGAGVLKPILVQVTTAFTAAGAGTLTVALQMDTTAAFGSPTALWTSAAIGKATLVAGYKFLISNIPIGTLEQFIRLNYTVATGPMTAGNIVAGIVAARNQAVIGG
ncbi:hypothetical protein LCGC14_0414170 [marine sediment metagenome]|uniref:Uncharacterized protein n=1 Tax=marine sediment metagenome TaxID=412755 RepID=A0A0F9VEX3_9ZZZZ